MRKITERVANALFDGDKAIIGNTAVTHAGEVFLHGNWVAGFDGQHKLVVTLAGWNTQTTRERVNGIINIAFKRYGLPDVPMIRQIRGVPYLIYRGEKVGLEPDDYVYFDLVTGEAKVSRRVQDQQVSAG